MQELDTTTEESLTHLEGLYNKQHELEGRIKSWFYRFKPWELPKEKLEELKHDNEQQIEEEVKKIKSKLVEHFVLENMPDSRDEVQDPRADKYRTRDNLDPKDEEPQSPHSPRTPDSPDSPGGSRRSSQDYNYRISTFPENIKRVYVDRFALSDFVAEHEDDNLFVDALRSLYRTLQKMLGRREIIPVMSVDEFSDLLVAYYELQIKRQECLQLKKLLQEEEHEFQKTKHGDYYFAHQNYNRNLVKLAQVEAALQSTQKLIDLYSAGYLQTPEGKALLESQSHDAVALKSTVDTANKHLRAIEHKIEQLRSAKSEVRKQAHNIINTLNPWATPAKNLAEQLRHLDEQISSEQAALVKPLKDKFVAEYQLIHESQPSIYMKAGAVLAAAGIVAVKVFKSQAKTVQRALTMDEIWQPRVPSGTGIPPLPMPGQKIVLYSIIMQPQVMESLIVLAQEAIEFAVVTAGAIIGGKEFYNYFVGTKEIDAALESEAKLSQEPSTWTFFEPDDATARHQAFQEFAPGKIDPEWEAHKLRQKSSELLTENNKAAAFAEYAVLHPEKYSADEVAHADEIAKKTHEEGVALSRQIHALLHPSTSFGPVSPYKNVHQRLAEKAAHQASRSKRTDDMVEEVPKKPKSFNIKKYLQNKAAIEKENALKAEMAQKNLICRQPEQVLQNQAEVAVPGNFPADTGKKKPQTDSEELPAEVQPIPEVKPEGQAGEEVGAQDDDEAKPDKLPIKIRPNNLHHIVVKPDHGFFNDPDGPDDDLKKKIKDAIEKVIDKFNDGSGEHFSNGQLFEISSKLKEFGELCVRGAVVDGVIHVATAYIKK